MLGHDLRGPLNTVLMTSHVISASSAGSAVSQHTQKLMRSDERMRQLLDDLLDYNRTSLHLGIPISPQLCDLASVCEEEIHLLRAAWPAASIRFETYGKTRGHWDPSRIMQVVSNLVNNAVKYGASHGTVVASVRGEEDAAVRLVVENTGPTIAKDVLHSFFGSLSRCAEASRAGRTKRPAWA